LNTKEFFILKIFRSITNTEVVPTLVPSRIWYVLYSC